MEEYTEKQVQEWKSKAAKWDTLSAKIARYYVDTDGEELPEGEGGNLLDIGEAAARALGYM